MLQEVNNTTLFIIPVKSKFLKVVEIASDVFERVIGDSRAPAEVEAAQARQVLC